MTRKAGTPARSARHNYTEGDDNAENMYRRFSFRSLDGTGRFALVGIPCFDYRNGADCPDCDWRAAVIEFLCKLAHLIILIRRILK